MAECLQMCPDVEIEFRNENRLVHQLEATPSTSIGPRSKFVGDRERMVKEYTRSAADTHKYNKPELLRPVSVLHRTIAHLLQIYEDYKDSDQFSMAFSFVSDRLRAVRQDMIMQRIRGIDAISLLEAMLPFYIETGAICKQRKVSAYEPKLHDSQLEECFGRWFQELEVLESAEASEPIIICFFLRQLSRKPGILHDLHVLRSKINPSVFQILHNVTLSYQTCNFIRFFRVFQNLDRLSQCSLVDAVLEIRLKSMKVISVGFKNPVAKIHVNIISEWLGVVDETSFFSHFCDISSFEDGRIQISRIKVPEISDNLKFSGSQF